MSSITTRKPEFRLQLGYPDVILTREGETEPIGSATPGSDRFGADLRRLAAEVLRGGGRLTVVLPASEVWRGQVEPGGRAPRAEWRAARARAAAALGVDADALRTVVGRAVGAGPVPAAAVRRSTLAEVRTLLASVGLKPAAIVGAGAFEGFAAPPRLGARWTPPPVGRRRALAGAGGLAFAAIALMVMAIRPDAAPVVEAPAAVAPAVVAVAAAPAACRSRRCRPSPRAGRKPRQRRRSRCGSPAPTRRRTGRWRRWFRPARSTSRSPRSAPATSRWSIVERKGEPVAELRLAELTDPRGPLTDVDVPLHRPVAGPCRLGGRRTRAGGGTAACPASENADGGCAGEVKGRSAPVAVREAGGRPMPRPAADRCRAPRRSRCGSPRWATR